MGKWMATFLFVVGLLGAGLACSFTAKERPALRFAPGELPAATVGQAYQATITVSDNETPVFDMGVSAGELPAGLAWQYESGETAAIAGTPTEAGSFSFTIHASCLGTNVSGQMGEQAYQIMVNGE